MSNSVTNSVNNKPITDIEAREENPTPPIKKKKKKKNASILYQQTAVKYFNGFMKNKRYKKGINLSTGCAIFKTAWELPESNGLILPSRVVRHFKQVLPKKPPPKKKATNKTNIVRANTLSQDDPLIIRSRTMQNMHDASALSPHINISPHDHESISTEKNIVSLINVQNAFCDQIEAMIDEQKVEEDTVEIKRKKHMISKSVDITTQIYDEYYIDITTKHKISPTLKHKKEMKLKLSDTDMYDDHDTEAYDTEKKKKEKKKKKKKKPVLYAEVATKLFKKINDGKRFKNGITLKRACNIMSVAWELPQDNINGRVLPSKIVRHFKHVLPSKTAAIAIATPQTMRGHMHHMQHNWLREDSMRRSLAPITVKNDAYGANKPKESIISHLESLLVSDPNRIRNDDHQGQVISRRDRAGTMTDLDLDIMEVDNEIEKFIKDKKKKENDAINAIDASFGL